MGLYTVSDTLGTLIIPLLQREREREGREMCKSGC